MRADQTVPARLFTAPVWRHEPPTLQAGLALQRLKPYHPETWRCSLWQVHNPDAFPYQLGSMQWQSDADVSIDQCRLTTRP